jgi:CheY-specific phosphatase CheX
MGIILKKVHSLLGIKGKMGGYVFYELNEPVVRKIAEKKKSNKTKVQKIVCAAKYSVW